MWLIVTLDLKQRVRGVAWYVLLGVFVLLVTIVTVLLVLATNAWDDGGGGVFSTIVFFVLLLATLVSPALSGNAINGEREAGTLATTQVTLVSTAQLVVGKWVAAWLTALAFLAASLPFLVFAVALGQVSAGTIAISTLVLALELGVIAAIGVGLSGLLTRPLFSVTVTYLVVAALSVGTLIGFGLGGAAIQTTVRQTYIGVDWQSLETDGPPPSGQPAPCLPPEVREYTTPRFDLVWGFLAANPYVVVADAAPGSFDEFGSPRDLFGWIAVGVRTAQHAARHRGGRRRLRELAAVGRVGLARLRDRRRRSTTARCRRGSWGSRARAARRGRARVGMAAHRGARASAFPPGAAWPEAQPSGASPAPASSAARTSSSSPAHGVTQRALGVEPLRAGGCHEREQRAAELVLRGGRAAASRHPGRPHRDADLRGLAEHLLRERERGHAARDAVEHARAMRLLVGLQLVPERHHVVGRLGRAVAAEDVRMPRHHLRGHVRRDVLDVEVLAGRVRGEVGVEQHLVEHVAELLDHLVAVARLDRVDELPALLDEVLHEALVGLVGVPRAAARRAQQRDGGDELVECRCIRRGGRPPPSRPFARCGSGCRPRSLPPTAADLRLPSRPC